MTKMAILEQNMAGFYAGDLFVNINGSYYEPYKIDIINGIKTAIVPGLKFPDEYIRYLHEIIVIDARIKKPDENEFISLADLKKLVSQLSYIDVSHYDASLHNDAVSKLRTLYGENHAS